MKKIIALLIGAGGLTLLPILHSYRQLHSYYSRYQIDIKQWVDSDEWLTLSLDAYVDYLKFSLLILGIVFFILKFDSFAKREAASAKSRAKRKINIFRYLFIANVPWIVLALLWNNKTIESSNGLMLYIFSYAVFFLLIFLRETSARFVYKLSDKVILLGVFFWMLLTHPLLYADKKELSIKASVCYNTLNSVVTLDSLTYLGSSKNYFFLYSKANSSTFIVRKDSTRSVIVENQESKVVIQ
jgi:hypothetical protein